MLQNYNRYRILQEFFNCPTKNFHMREISRITKIAQPSVTNHLKALVNEGLVIKEKKGLYPSFRANRDNELFKLYKKFDLIFRINRSGLLDYLHDNLLPDAMILFGSASRGEDIEESDVDLFILGKENKVNLEKFEKVIHREIALFFEENFSRLNKELKNNILNGILLRGYLKVF